MKRVALVTCRTLPEPDPDQDLQLEALRSRGLRAETLAWDDPGAEAGSFDLCVLRSAWNYYRNPGAFLDFVVRAARDSRLVNSESVVRWNIHKSYLARLREGGVPIIPTAFFDRGSAVDVAAIMEERGWGDVVMKPAVSAASYHTRRFRRGEAGEARAFMRSLLRDGDALMQRTMEGFAAPGEAALVWIDGEFTHKVLKRPRFQGEDEKVSSGLGVSDEERAVGARALACVGEELVYARVDVVEHEGALVVSELELMEPSLFFAQDGAALARFADAIARLAATAAG